MINIIYFYFFILSIIVWFIYYKKNHKMILLREITSNYKESLISLNLKFLLSFALYTITLFFSILYTFTASGKLSDKEIAKAIFNSNSEDIYVANEQFFNHKLFLQNNDTYLELKIADETLNNRWTEGDSKKVSWSNNQYGYSIAIIDDINDSTKKGVVVFGRNKDAKTIKISFNKNIYSTFITENDYFIITYPTFEKLDQNTDIYNVYSTSQSTDLKVFFYDNDGIICQDMEYIY